MQGLLTFWEAFGVSSSLELIHVLNIMWNAIFSKMVPVYVERQLAREKESEQAAEEVSLPDPSAPDKTQQIVPTERSQIQMKQRQHWSCQKFPLWFTDHVVVPVFANIMALLYLNPWSHPYLNGSLLFDCILELVPSFLVELCTILNP